MNPVVGLLLTHQPGAKRAPGQAPSDPPPGEWPEFDLGSLPEAARPWHTRLLNAMTHANPYPNAASYAASGNLYGIGRFVASAVTSLLSAYRVTRDRRLLDGVDALMQAARGSLSDSDGDGYRNWRWLQDPSVSQYYGNDLHVMDEILSHALVAHVAWVYHQHRGAPSPGGVDYAERADFWREYADEWEAKWRDRNGKPSGFPFIDRNLMHPYVNLIRYHFYQHKLTGRGDYLAEAERLASRLWQQDFVPITTAYGPGLVYRHGVTRDGSGESYLQPTNYAHYTAQVLVDLALEGFAGFTLEEVVRPLANTVAARVLDNGTIDFAGSIGGSSAIGGVPYPPGEPRYTREQWSILALGELAAFDTSGLIAAANLATYNAIEGSSNNSPRRLAMPAAMLLAHLPPGSAPAPQVTPPPAGSSLYWQLQGSVPLDRPEAAYDVDGFNTSSGSVSLLKQGGKYTIAHFSGGTFEDWRPDAASFPEGVKGAALDGWPGERWLDTSQLSLLEPIMAARAQLAADKGFHAIEWDNLDGHLYGGYSVNLAQHQAYLQMLADVSHARGLAAVFKNAPELAAWASSRFDACLAEEAYRYGEVDAYMPWRAANKPLWVVEYQGSLDCADAAARGLFLVQYPLALNGPPTATCDLTPDPLLGVASASSSEADYPRTGPVTVGNYYVATTGSDSNTGTSLASPLRTIQAALSKASSGQTILVRAGTYALNSAITLSKSVRLFAYGNERPVLDRGLGQGANNTTSGEAAYALRVQASNVHVKGFTIKGVPERNESVSARASSYAVLVTGAGAKLEDLHIRDGRTGSVRFTTGANDGLAQDIIIWNNRQVLLPSSPTNTWDGIAGTHGSYDTNSINNLRIVRCLVANAGDDGFDLWAAKNSRIIDCVSVAAGYHPDGSSTPGDGGGFKMGGSAGGAGGNLLQGCLAIGARGTGLKSNSTKGAANTYRNNTLVHNAHGVIADTDANAPALINNIALHNTTYNTSILSSNRQHNTFDLGISDAKFAAPSARDYSLGAGSACRAAGVNGEHLGASAPALRLYLEWAQQAGIHHGRAQ